VYDNAKTIQAGLDFNDLDRYVPADFFFDKFKNKPASVPYSNAAHHLLSCDAFTDKKNERIFDDDELAILWAVGYDVNHGENVIFLPGYNDGGEVLALARRAGLTPDQWGKLPKGEKKRRADGAKRRARARTHKYANLHRLPCHYDYHKPYIKKVKTDMKRLQPRLRRQIGKICKTWKPPKSIMQFLTDREHVYWRWVVNFGKSSPWEPKSIGEITGMLPKKGKEGRTRARSPPIASGMSAGTCGSTATTTSTRRRPASPSSFSTGRRTTSSTTACPSRRSFRPSASSGSTRARARSSPTPSPTRSSSSSSRRS
jgi:hypothetical protein